MKNIELVDISELKQDPKNARKHDRKNIDTIKASLIKFGQQKPLVIDSEMKVIAGNGTLEAAKEIGWESIKVIKTDLDKSEAEAYSIADNRTAELAVWNNEMLAELFVNMEDLLKPSTGFLDKEIEYLIQSASGITVDNESDEWVGMPEFRQEDLQSKRRLIVHFRSDEDVEEFSSLVGQKISEKTRFIWYPESKKVVEEVEYTSATDDTNEQEQS